MFFEARSSLLDSLQDCWCAPREPCATELRPALRRAVQRPRARSFRHYRRFPARKEGCQGRGRVVAEHRGRVDESTASTYDQTRCAHRNVHHRTAPSFNGRTPDSGAGYRGSNPWGAANLLPSRNSLPNTSADVDSCPQIKRKRPAGEFPASRFNAQCKNRGAQLLRFRWFLTPRC